MRNLAVLTCLLAGMLAGCRMVPCSTCFDEPPTVAHSPSEVAHSPTEKVAVVPPMSDSERGSLPMGRTLPAADVEGESPSAADAEEPEERLDDSVSSGQSLLAELQRRAESRSPSLARAAAKLEALDGKWLQAGLRPNPVLGYIAEDIGEDGSSGRHGAYWSRQFAPPEKLALRRVVVEQEMETARRQVEVQRLRIQTDVRIGYIRFLVAVRRMQLAKELVDVAVKAVRDTKILVVNGDAKQADTLRAEAEASSMRLQLQNAAAQRDAAWHRLAIIVGDSQLRLPDLDEETVAATLESQLSRLKKRGESLNRLLTESPELAVSRSQVEVARWAVESARANGIPNFNLQLTVQGDTATGDAISGVQLGIPLPINNWNQGGVRQAQAELVAADRAVSTVEMRLSREFETVFQRYEIARQQIAAYRGEDGILSKTKQMLSLTVRSIEAGEAKSLDMLTAQRIYAQANISYLEAVLRLSVAAAEINGLLLKDSDQPF